MVLKKTFLRRAPEGEGFTSPPPLPSASSALATAISRSPPSRQATTGRFPISSSKRSWPNSLSSDCCTSQSITYSRSNSLSEKLHPAGNSCANSSMISQARAEQKIENRESSPYFFFWDLFLAKVIHMRAAGCPITHTIRYILDIFAAFLVLGW